MPKFRKKPVVIDAIQYTGENLDDIKAFAGSSMKDIPENAATKGIMTLEGFKPLPKGYWIIKGVAGEFYPCEPAIFHKTYELVEE